ncbi:hypothetical protein CDO52_21965 [Nocardiopsis gilva YIM 90087]|uniref:Lactonase family protein n=1 Tax=Nocardiopsis gilva YIM 90087 TaxID=1235441 RepID=A0A223SAE8_9ACTN|nr:lactonase family protein [Nocardiopsis gilva]ASU85104.1 hypothetical protein CDO52_21965 [Nocardiopsis gilva YIM 90087]
MAGQRALWIGTYTPDSDPAGAGAGIHRVWLDRATGALTDGGVVARTAGPSFLAAHPRGDLIYAVNECAEGGLSGFSVGTEGALTHLGTVATGGASPCHISVHPSGHHVVVANYADGSGAVHAIGDDGAPRAASVLLRHTGSGPEAARQAGPHAHQVSLAPDGRHLLITDLGTDELRCYELDAVASGRPSAAAIAARLAPGSGPRHVAVHPNGHLYVTGELDSRIHILRWESATATAVPVGDVPATDAAGTTAGKGGRNYPAEAVLAADGTRLYVSNRGADTIATFEVASDGASLHRSAETPTGGAWPRHFALVDGVFLVSANQNSGDLTVLRVDPDTGVPHTTGHRLALPDPVCVLPA